MSKLKRGIAKVSTALVGAVAVLAPTLVLAALDASSTAITPAGEPNGTYTFTSIINTVVTIFLYVIGIVAVLYLLIAGFNYITAGGDDEKATAARKGIINAVIGIIIVVAVFYIFGAAKGVGKTITSGTASGF